VCCKTSVEVTYSVERNLYVDNILYIGYYHIYGLLNSVNLAGYQLRSVISLVEITIPRKRRKWQIKRE
jgi:hypothetical protein